MVPLSLDAYFRQCLGDGPQQMSSWIPRLSTEPLVVDLDTFNTMLSVQEALYISMRCVLRLWWQRDPHVCSVLSLPSRLEHLLRSGVPTVQESSTCPYLQNIGSYRPDFVIDESNTFRVCEINARFALNGFLMTVFLSQAAQAGLFPTSLPVSAFPFGHSSLNNDMSMSSNEESNGVAVGIPATLAFPQAVFRRFINGVGPLSGDTSTAPSSSFKSLSSSVRQKKVFVISDREPSHDLQWLSALATRTLQSSEKLTFEHVHSSALSVKAVKGHSGANDNDNDNDQSNLALMVRDEVVESCILELHQDELLSLSDEVLLELMRLSAKGLCLNPLWTIALLHDKRLLSLLPTLDELFVTTTSASEQVNCQNSISSDELAILREEYKRIQPILCKHIIPTVVCDAQQMTARELRMLSHVWQARLVAKPALLGKGEGIVVQSPVSTADEFLSLLQSKHRSAEETSYLSHNLSPAAPGSITASIYVLQPFIAQRRFAVRMDGQEDSSVVQWPCVGTLLCLDSDFYGPGIFRCADSQLIALSTGGIAVAPVHWMFTEKPHTVIRDSQWDVRDAKLMQSMRRQLVDEGIAIFQPVNPICHLECDTSPTAQESFTASIVSLLEAQWSATLRAPVLAKQSSSADEEVALRVPSTKDTVWTISPKACGLARSHQSSAFDTHTDASYEAQPPRFICLAVLRDDRKGGGHSGFANIASVIAELTDAEFDILRTVKVKWTVPLEFRAPNPHRDDATKDKENEEEENVFFAPVLMSRSRARIRADIMSIDHLLVGEQARFRKAFDRFHRLLSSACEHKSRCQLPVGSVLFLDNQRFVHSRSAICDAERSLIRIRFDLSTSPELESFLYTYRQRQSLSTELYQELPLSLSACPIQTKTDLLHDIHSLSALNHETTSPFLGKGNVYWSPSGGSTSSALTAEQCAIPSALSDNALQRTLMADQLRQGRVFHEQSVVANCFGTGQLYRSLEIFHEWIVDCHGTDLPLGTLASEEAILSVMTHFSVNTLCGWPSKLLKLVDTAQKGQSLHREALRRVHTIVIGGEPLGSGSRQLLLSVTAPQCRIVRIFGSAETGIFASTLSADSSGNTGEAYDAGADDCDEIYTVIPDAVHIELLTAEDGGRAVSSANSNSEGTLVVTNLLRRSAQSQAIVRFWMNDQARRVSDDEKRRRGIDSEVFAFRLIGRSPQALTFPIGPIFLRWIDIQERVLSLFVDIGCPLSSMAAEKALTAEASGITAQLWISESDFRTGMDVLMLRVHIPSLSAAALESNETFVVTERQRAAAEDAMRQLVSEVDNIESVHVCVDSSLEHFVVNNRSGKRMLFVDKRIR